MSKSPGEILEDMTAEILSLRRAVDTRVMTKEQAVKLEEALTNWGWKASSAAEKLERGNKNVLSEATKIATEAAERALEAQLEKIRAGVDKAAEGHSKAAGEARRNAWLYFGGFWVWLSTVFLAGLLCGVVGLWLASDARNASDFGKNPNLWCELAGGERGITKDESGKYCAFFFD